MRLIHPAATDAEVEWALDIGGLTADIAALPQGVETRISNSRSEQLPYGFHQKLSLARAMLKPAAVVLLDEPGAGLDEAGEEHGYNYFESPVFNVKDPKRFDNPEEWPKTLKPEESAVV